MDEDADGTVASTSLVLDLHSILSPLPDNIHIQESSSSTRNLVECSELDDDDILWTLCCNDWKEAVIGWRQTAPCVKYAWAEEPKRELAGRHGEVKKQKPRGTKPKSSTKDFDWRSTVEPGTYRYSPGGIHSRNIEPHISSPTPGNDDILRQIKRVRDHFERTLQSANKPAKLPSRKKSSEACDPKKSISEGALREFEYDEDSCSRRTSRQWEGNLDQSASAESIRRRPFHHQDHLNHMWRQYQVQKVEINNPFVGDVKNHTPEGTHQLKLTHARKSPLDHNCLPKHDGRVDCLTNSSLTGWGDLSGFVIEAEPLLNPLKKVTPKQRKIHDDSEAIEFYPTTGPRPASSKILSLDAELLPTERVSPEKEQVDLLLTERFKQLCFKVNSDRIQPSIPSKYSHEQFSLANELQSVQDILQAQKYISKQIEQKPERQRYKPHRLRRLPPHTRAGDLHHGKGDLGEPLHRGIIDRKTASDLAAELMPGIHGHKLEPPPYAYRIV